MPYTTAGQGWPEPSPYDAVMLDRKVRFVGDRVAVVAAEDPELAHRACEAIEVEYELLPARLRPRAGDGRRARPSSTTRPTPSGIKDASRNLAAEIVAEVGDVATGFAEAERVFEETYRVPYVQQSSIEPHITITWLDEDDRLMVRTSTQVPFHVRRIIAPLLGIPVRRIRVIKPRIGGGFGGKQEILHRGPLRDADPAHRPARAASSTRARRSSPRPARAIRRSSPSRAACSDGQLRRHRAAGAREHRRLRHARAHGDERDRQPRALPLPLPQPALRGARRLHEPGRGRRLPRLRLPAGLLRAGEPHGRGRARARRGPAGVPPPQPRAGGRRPADRGGAGRGQGGLQADHPLLRPAPGHRAGAKAIGWDAEARKARRGPPGLPRAAWAWRS